MRTLASLLLAALATPALSLDDCLVGRWQVDTSDLAAVLAAQMSGEAHYVEGGVTMQIKPDGAVDILLRDLVLNVTVPGAPAMDLSVNGASRGSLTAENGGWTLTVVNYDLVGTADVMGAQMEIPFNAASGMFGGSSGSYVCEADFLRFDHAGNTPRLPRRWARAG